MFAQYIPSEIKSLCSPFFGGGSIELYLDSKGIKIFGYDIFEPLVNFWQHIISNPVEVANIVKQYYPLNKNKFYYLQKNYYKYYSKKEMAAIYYVLNRSSFSGLTFFGGMSPNHPRFSTNSIKKLENFTVNNLIVEKLDFTLSIPKHKQDFLYCDPPYLNKEKLYYNSTKFNHEELYYLLEQHDNWILSYNDCETIRKMYNKYKIIIPEWKYGMSKQKKSNELLIINF